MHWLIINKYISTHHIIIFQVSIFTAQISSYKLITTMPHLCMYLRTFKIKKNVDLLHFMYVLLIIFWVFKCPIHHRTQTHSETYFTMWFGYIYMYAACLLISYLCSSQNMHLIISWKQKWNIQKCLYLEFFLIKMYRLRCLSEDESYIITQKWNYCVHGY